MTSPTPLSLPAHITGNVPSGASDTLRTVPPRVLAPSPTDPKATAHAIGAHVLRLPARLDTRAAKIDGTPVLFALDGKETHVFVDSVVGVVEVIGWSAPQVATIRQYFDAVDAPVSALDAAVDRLAATGASSLSPTDRSPEAKEVTRLLGLSDEIDGNVANGYLATKATLGDAREVDRLVALADTLDDGTSSGDSEVARLAALADSLSDG